MRIYGGICQHLGIDIYVTCAESYNLNKETLSKDDKLVVKDDEVELLFVYVDIYMSFFAVLNLIQLVVRILLSLS